AVRRLGPVAGLARRRALRADHRGDGRGPGAAAHGRAFLAAAVAGADAPALALPADHQGRERALRRGHRRRRADGVFGLRDRDRLRRPFLSGALVAVNYDPARLDTPPEVGGSDVRPGKTPKAPPVTRRREPCSNPWAPYASPFSPSPQRRPLRSPSSSGA